MNPDDICARTPKVDAGETQPHATPIYLASVYECDDPEQAFLVDGITEQIITGLSRMPYMFVIARNTSFTYKGEPVKIQ